MKKPSPFTIMRAHQFLYYCRRYVWSDYEYDQFCKQHKLDGNGGSDRPDDYTAEEKGVAEMFETNPNAFSSLT